MAMGLLFLGQAAAKAKQGEIDAAANARIQRDHILHGLHKQKPLSKEDAQLLKDIQVQLSDKQLHHSTRCCPECRRPFALVRMRDVVVDYCTFCRGCWFDPGELGLVAHTDRDIPSTPTTHRHSKHKCPVCDEVMWEHVYRKPFNLLVDRCSRGHGVYLEKGELERVLRMT